MRISEWFKKYARGRGVSMAYALEKELKRVVGKQAPTRTTRTGKIVATTKAKPFAPPRRVSGNLQKKIRVVRTAHGARVVMYAPYSVRLEYSNRWYGWPHRALAVALKNLGLKSRNG